MTILSVACERSQQHHAFFGLHLVNHSLLSVHQRNQFRQKLPTHRGEVALALQHACKAREVRLQPVLLGVAIGCETKVVDHRIDVVFEFRYFAAGLHLNRSGQVSLGDGGGDLGDGPHLVGKVVSQKIDVAREILPCSGCAGHVCLTAQSAFDAHLAGDCSDLVGKGGERARHVVDCFRQSSDFALRVHTQFLSEFPVGDRGHDLHDAAYLLGEVGGHNVHVVGEILPRACHARHLSLPAEFAFRSHFACHTRDFSSKGV